MSEDIRFIICSIIAIIFWGGFIYFAIVNPIYLGAIFLTIILLLFGAALVAITAAGLSELWEYFDGDK